MTSAIAPGTVVTTEFGGRPCRVGALLGKGTQGEVYRATVDGMDLALKWYVRGNVPADQRDRLRDLIRTGAPSDRFLWPTDLASAPGVPHFGYLMPLLDPRFVEASRLVTVGGPRASPHGTALLCERLADAFNLLHMRDLYYADVSLRNVLADPVACDVLVCDTDNVAFQGRRAAGVLGTKEFAAPEVILGTAAPDSASDRHSFAVLVFYLLFGAHPLRGRRDASRFDDETALYATDPLFVFDPADASNRPDPALQPVLDAVWRAYPAFLRRRFERAFGPALRDRGLRDPESIWRADMQRLADLSCVCPSCRAERYFDPEDAGSQPCYACGAGVVRPLVLTMLDARGAARGGGIALVPGRRLLRRHVERVAEAQGSEAVGEVVVHPARPGVTGLRNVGNAAWKVHAEGAAPAEVGPGRVLGLSPGTRIGFGTREALVTR